MSALENGDRFSKTATNATSAVATQAGVTGKKSYITDISGSSDKAGSVILVKDGTTVLWQDLVNAGSYNMNFTTPLTGSVGADISVTVDGTAACKANVSGVSL